MVSQHLTVREARGSDSNSDYTHSSLADSNYSLISGDDAAILTDEDDASTRDGLDSVASFDTDDEEDSVYIEEPHTELESSSGTTRGKGRDTDSIDDSLLEEHSSVMKESGACTITGVTTETSQILFNSTTSAVHSTSSSEVPVNPYLRMADQPLALGAIPSYHIIYHGRDEGLKQQIVEKVAQAVSLSIRPKSDSQGSSAFTVVPVSDFGYSKVAPEVELVPSNGLNLIVKTCAMCAKNEVQCLDDVGTCEADLEVFCHPANQPIQENFQCSLHFLHDTTPIIEVLADRHYLISGAFLANLGSEVREDDFDGWTDFSSVFHFHSFVQLDPSKLNRHIAYLEDINRKGARLRVNARRSATQLTHAAYAALQNIKSLKRKEFFLNIKASLLRPSPGVVMMVLTLFLSSLLPMFFSSSNTGSATVVPVASPSHSSRGTPVTISAPLPPVASLLGSPEAVHISQDILSWAKKSKEQLESKRQAHKISAHVSTEGTPSSPMGEPKPNQAQRNTERSKATLGEVISKELMVLQQSAKELVVSTGERVEKGLMLLNHESKALMRYSAEKLTGQHSSLTKKERRELKKMKYKLKMATKLLERATRSEVRDQVGQFRDSLRIIRKQARQTVKDAQKAVKNARSIARFAHGQAFSSAQFNNLRDAFTQQHTWYKSKRLGRARAASRRLINRVTGREVYTTGLDYE